MTYWIFITTAFAGTIYLFLMNTTLQIKRKKPSQVLEEILFPFGKAQKRKVIEAFKKVTPQKFSDEEIIDFFMKEKGLQMIPTNPDLSQSLVKYIRKDTLIDLNYFERVKFHETFINYPRNFEVPIIESAGTIFNELPRIKVASLTA